MAAALAQHHAGEQLEVHSAGTQPGTVINAESAASLEEVGADMSQEHPSVSYTHLTLPTIYSV